MVRHRNAQSLKSLLLSHELALALLVLVTGALGGAWGLFWQRTSTEGDRLQTMTFAAQRIRSALFRQIKEVVLARLMEDEKALKLYGTYSRQIDAAFNSLREKSVSRDEQNGVQALQLAYRVVQHDMNNVFTSPYMLNRVARLKILDPNYEQRLVGEFDKAYDELDRLMEAQRTDLNNSKTVWVRRMPFILPVPLIAAAALVVFSRSKLQDRFVRPMSNVLNGALAMRAGDLDKRIDSQGVEEVAVLAESLNAMAGDLKQSRDALVETEKQAALGSLVPVIAHNVRNPLAAIRANAQLLDPDDKPDDLYEAKQAIIDTVDRLGRWVTALVAYLHPSQPQLRLTRPSVVTKTVLNLLRQKLDEAKVSARESWPADECPVAMDADLTEQCLFGLISNAVEASPKDGHIWLQGVLDGDYYRLRIGDQGAGMPFTPSSGTRLQPGRTTKRFGTGLGIPFAYKVCSLHGWSLTFNERAGGGTWVEIAMKVALDDSER